MKITITIMSGVEDGNTLEYDSTRGDGQQDQGKWRLSIGRKDENDICLKSDTYISRWHANIIYEAGHWLLEDCKSTNGSFLENPDDFFNDIPIQDTVILNTHQLFRIGKTWLRIETIE
ncbi:MAG: hypothetical protein Kow00117_17100 [Phototrophicales bacterium]